MRVTFQVDVTVEAENFEHAKTVLQENIKSRKKDDYYGLISLVILNEEVING